ncbi:MAG: enoyl-CoA hydratase-related protein [Beijerinckiaceae bacterium]
MQRQIETTSERLQASIQHGIATVVINAPQRRNCIDLATWKAFPPLFAALDTERDLRAVLLKGQGHEAFSTGADIAEFETARATAEGSRTYEIENVRAFEAVSALSRPVIAVIHGYCFGAGVGLAAACDIRMASDDAVFSVPAARLGVGYPPVALKSLVALMGPEPVKHLFFSAGRLDAAKALAVGLVGEVVAKSALDEAALTLAREIASGAPMTITAAKRAIDAAAGLPGALGMQKLQLLADACFQSQDYAEGRAAFRDKRKPLFRGE